MGRPLALDLFCGAGGASKGLHQAGFRVIGVDLADQPHYPFDFVRADALKFKLPKEAVFVWASPPCQAFTAYKRRPDHVFSKPNLIPATRAKLLKSKKLYVIENVVGAPLLDPIMLCGSMFGLDVQRHRIFESNLSLSLNFRVNTAFGQLGSRLRRTAKTSERPSRSASGASRSRSNNEPWVLIGCLWSNLVRPSRRPTASGSDSTL